MLRPLTAKGLVDVFGISKKDATFIYKQMREIHDIGHADDVLRLLDSIGVIESLGVEPIYIFGEGNEPALLYMNTGDTYSSTIMYDNLADKFYIGAWGDWVESMEQSGKRFE